MPRKRADRTVIPPGVVVAAGTPPLDREIKTRIDAGLHRLVQEAAAREDRSEAAIVRRALRAYLEGVDGG